MARILSQNPIMQSDVVAYLKTRRPRLDCRKRELWVDFVGKPIQFASVSVGCGVCKEFAIFSISASNACLHSNGLFRLKGKNLGKILTEEINYLPSAPLGKAALRFKEYRFHDELLAGRWNWFWRSRS